MRPSRLLPVLAGVCVLGLAVTFLVALHTAQGVHDDAALYRHVSGNAALPVKAAGHRALVALDLGAVVLATVLLAGIALVRRRVGRALAAVAVVVASFGSAEALKHGLGHLGDAIPAGRPATFPSGHTSIAVSLGLALVLAAPPVLRPTAALLGAAYGAGIGLAVIVLGWHYPSDVVGSFFVCGFWAAVAGTLLGDVPRRPQLSAAAVLVAAAAVAAALFGAAVLAQRHPGAMEAARSARSVVATAGLLGVLSLALFAAVTPLVGERPRGPEPSGHA